MDDKKFWLFTEHHGTFAIFEADDSVMPDLVRYYEDEGHVTDWVEDSDDGLLKILWAKAKESPTVENLRRFGQMWNDLDYNDDGVGRVHHDYEFLKR